MDVSEAKQAIIDDQKARQEAFAKELEGLCQKYNCTLIPQIVVSALLPK